MTVLTLGMEAGYLFERMLHPKKERLPVPKLDEEEKEIEPLEGVQMASVYTSNERNKGEK